MTTNTAKGITLKIDKHIPVPIDRRGGGQYSEFLEKLCVGDSFLVPSLDRHVVVSSAKSLKYKMTMRKENGQQHRIWRKK